MYGGAAESYFHPAHACPDVSSGGLGGDRAAAKWSARLYVYSGHAMFIDAGCDRARPCNPGHGVLIVLGCLGIPAVLTKGIARQQSMMLLGDIGQEEIPTHTEVSSATFPVA